MINKKGTSIIELIVSIALLSIVLAFMLKLLVDLNNVRTNTNFAKDNQIVRSSIIRTIENDIRSKDLKKIEKIEENCNSDLCIKFSFFDDTSSMISLNEDKILYSSTNNKNFKWTMNNCMVYVDKVYINQYRNDYTKKSYGFVMNIQIYTSNNENNNKRNNPIDDIQISYYNTFPSSDTRKLSDINIQDFIAK